MRHISARSITSSLVQDDFSLFCAYRDLARCAIAAAGDSEILTRLAGIDKGLFGCVNERVRNADPAAHPCRTTWVRIVRHHQRAIWRQALVAALSESIADLAVAASSVPALAKPQQTAPAPAAASRWAASVLTQTLSRLGAARGQDVDHHLKVAAFTIGGVLETSGLTEDKARGALLRAAKKDPADEAAVALIGQHMARGRLSPMSKGAGYV